MSEPDTTPDHDRADHDSAGNPAGTSEHDPATDPPGAVSNQLPEEQPSEHREDGTHPEPRTSGRKSGGHEPVDPGTGAAGEGSQSTGHRQNAG
jgi:hypothetical protein